MTPFSAWRCDADGLHPVREVSDPRDLPPGSFLWVETTSPGREDLRQVAERLGLHPRTVEDAAAERQHPRYDAFEALHVIVLRALTYTEATSSVESCDLSVVVTRRVLLAVRHGGNDPLSPARARLAREPGLLRSGPWAGVYAIAAEIVERHIDVADELSTDVSELERKVFAKGREDVIDQIYFLTREVLECGEAVEPMLLVSDEMLAAPDHHGVPLPYLRDLSRHARWAHTSVQNSQYLLTSILDAHQGQITRWQNEDVRKISAWAAIIAVPTLVSGIYGMNFSHMPELGWAFGYPMALLVMAVLCWILYRAFRRNGWL